MYPMAMITNQSKLFGRARKEAPSDAESASHKLLTRAGYIDQLGSGVFSLLPLGWRVYSRVADIIRDEMNKLGAQELSMPALQPSSLWAESGRLDKMDPPLFRVRDRHNKELVLASTHEEAVTDLARKNITSYKDLPLSVYQIQTKFRNEVRATGGLLRVREFSMKDLYSFHRTAEDLNTFYEAVTQAYLNIFTRCGLKAHIAAASSGTIGGAVSHEFQVEATTGEDKVAVCTQCNKAFNLEVFDASKPCPKCGGSIEIKSCVESGHTFQLGTKYSEVMHAYYTDTDGSQKPLVMGCYGIGLGRLMATIAETHHDDRGLQWPVSVSPYQFHVLALQETVRAEAEKLSQALCRIGDVLLDDRLVSPGQKLAEADLLGISTRIIVSEKNQEQNVIEVTNRLTRATNKMASSDFVKEASVGDYELT